MSPTFTLLVDGTQQPPGLFALSDMSLSSAVVDYLEPAYRSLVIGYKRDDELCGRPQDELAKASYLSLSEVLASPSLVELVFGRYLFRDLFGSQAWDGRDSNYWFDEVSSCVASDDVIKIAGVCYTQF